MINHFMKAAGKMTNAMERGYYISMKIINTKENGKMVFTRAMANLFSYKVNKYVHTLEIGQRANKMDKEP